MLIFVEGGKPENPEKNPVSKARTNNVLICKLNPHMAPGPGFEPGPRWWEESALTTAPFLLPSREKETENNIQVESHERKKSISLVSLDLPKQYIY